MSVRTKEEGPCRCPCHDDKHMLHIMPCCAYAHEPRDQAIVKAAILKAQKNAAVPK